jgi:putative signal transducing protein
VALVTLAVVNNELEAQMICGLLETNGIPCEYRNSSVGAAQYGSEVAGVIFGQGSTTEVLVEEARLEEARKLLPDDG